MRKTNTSGLPLVSTRLTATVSVALVLLLLGVAAALGLGARSVANDIRSNIGFVIVMADDATESDIAAMKQRLTRAQFVDSYTYASPAQVLERWQQLMGDENVSEVLDQNPFAPEIEVRVRQPWANGDSLRVISGQLEMIPSVAEVKAHEAMADDVNSTVNTLTMVLLAVAVTLLVISFVLINNTVRLTIYARRFSIHTMKLVGATAGFIRGPIVRQNMLDGLIAGFIADVILAGAIAYAHSADPATATLVSWTDAAWILGALPLAGTAICLLASLMATNRYIRIRYDDMYK